MSFYENGGFLDELVSDATPDNDDESEAAPPPGGKSNHPGRNETQTTRAPSGDHSSSSRSNPRRPYLPEARAETLRPLTRGSLRGEQGLLREAVREDERPEREDEGQDREDDGNDHATDSAPAEAANQPTQLTKDHQEGGTGELASLSNATDVRISEPGSTSSRGSTTRTTIPTVTGKGSERKTKTKKSKGKGKMVEKEVSKSKKGGNKRDKDKNGGGGETPSTLLRYVRASKSD